MLGHVSSAFRDPTVNHSGECTYHLTGRLAICVNLAGDEDSPLSLAEKKRRCSFLVEGLFLFSDLLRKSDVSILKCGPYSVLFK